MPDPNAGGQPPAPPEPPPPAAAFRRAWSEVPSVVLTFGSLCFGLGFLIVNLHLARYGILSSPFVRSQYVMAGALYLFLLAAAQAVLMSSIVVRKDGVDDWKAGRWVAGSLKIVMFVVWAFIGPSLALGLLSGSRLYAFQDLLQWKPYATVVLLYATLFFGNKAFTSIHGVWRNLTRSPAEREPRWEAKVDTAVQPVLSLLSLISVYAVFAYPLLSPEWGGGFRYETFLLPAADGVAVCRALGLSIQPNGRIGPVEVLSESDHEIVLAVADYRALRLSKALIQGMVVGRPQPSAPASPSEPPMTLPSSTPSAGPTPTPQSSALPSATPPPPTLPSTPSPAHSQVP